MTEQALDDLARRVMLDAARQEYGDLITELPGHDFSPTFERRMRRLVRRAGHPIRHRFVQAAACLLLAALLSGCAVLAVSQEARTALAGWIRELEREWSSYRYAGEPAGQPRPTVYYPAELPEGYREVMAPEPGAFVHALYEGGDGALLSFSYQEGLERTAFHVVWEDTTVQQIDEPGFQADLYLNTTGRTNVLVWTDEASEIVFWLTARLPEEELVRTARSVRESEPLGWVFRPSWFPAGTYIVASEEGNGEGDTLYETDEGIAFEFCYSKSGMTPYADRTDGQSIAVEDHAAVLYLEAQGGPSHVLTWRDAGTGYAFWLVSEIPVEDMIQIAESVEVYQRNMNDVFIIDTSSPEDAPLCKKVEQALTDEFAGQVRACAEHDAEAGIYMQSGYVDLVTSYMKTHISPERDSAACVTDYLEDITSDGKPIGNHILCLAEPLYFADLYVGFHSTTANLYDERGVMIAGYNGESGLWTDVETFEEKQFHHAADQIYAAAFYEAYG